MTAIIKPKSIWRVVLRVLYNTCRERRSLKPIRMLWKKYRYGSRRQFKGNLVSYVKYCRRTKQTIAIGRV